MLTTINMKIAIFLIFLTAVLAENGENILSPLQTPHYQDVLRQILPEQSTFFEDITSRITGGEISKRHQFPFQVGLFTYRGSAKYLCGGSLISQSFVLTGIAGWINLMTLTIKVF
jgi:hypothetical protein